MGLRPIDFAWASLRTITQMQPTEVKLIVDDIEYPVLERDSVGYLVHLSSPQRYRDNLFRLHGMYFDNDENGRISLWRMFKASVYHLSLHVATTDYGIYKSMFETFPSSNNLMFAISQVEDFAIKGHMNARWRGLLFDTAYANYLSSRRFRDLSRADFSVRVAANILSYSLVGKAIFSLGEDVDNQLGSLHKSLLEVESLAQREYSIPEPATQRSKMSAQSLATLRAKTNAVEAIYAFLQSQNCDLAEIPSPPFADNHGANEIFDSTTEVMRDSLDGFDSISRQESSDLLMNMSKKEIEESEKFTKGEAQMILSDWEYSLISMKKLVELHKSLDPKTHFEDFLLPKEDYSEFVRTRSKMIGPIRLVLDRLRMIKFTTDEAQGKESGYADIPKAIQVIASKSERNDVFIQEEDDIRSEAWAIVIDSSKSLETFQGEVRDVAVCLTEVAKDLMPNPNSWACYSFNENFYILKDFSEIHGNATKSRIGGVSTGLKTFLPDAMRIAAARLKSSTEDIKVMLVISDGFPLGYEGIDQQLIDTIEKISKSGIQLVGMGIGSSSMMKYFRTNFPANSPFELMKNFIRTYTELSSSF